MRVRTFDPPVRDARMYGWATGAWRLLTVAVLASSAIVNAQSGFEADPSWRDAGGDWLDIVVGDRDAVDPLPVDTLISGNADFALEMNQAYAKFGISMAAAGDVNGDGNEDFMVGAWEYDDGQADEGAAFIYFGGQGAFDPGRDAHLQSNQISAAFGISVAGAGDFNGDGYDDVIVGAPWAGSDDAGAAYLYFGGSGAFDTAPDAVITGTQAGERIAYAVAGAGDLNGDGYDDLAIGAHLHDGDQVDEGAVFVYFGSSGVFSGAPDVVLESNQVLSSFGYSLAGAGDVNGDGYDDLLVGAYLYDSGEVDEGAVLLYLGGGNFNAVADAILQSNQVSAYHGKSVAAAGDVNRDGYADVVVGAPSFDNGQSNEGAAFLYLGGASFNTSADAQLEGNQIDAAMGTSVAGAGDVNKDQYSDLLVGARWFDNGQVNEGAVFVYYGGPGAFNQTADAQLGGDQANAEAGTAVAIAGDVNRDGYDDVLVGAPLLDNGQVDEGAALLYLGAPEIFANGFE